MSVKASDTAIRLKEVSPVGTAFYPIGSSLRPLRIFLAHFAVKALDHKVRKGNPQRSQRETNSKCADSASSNIFPAILTIQLFAYV
jgi:hypothetical protein